MYLLRVVPLAKLIRPAPDEFFYFSKFYHNFLSLVEVPLRKNKVPALVVDVEKLENRKEMLKKEVSFSLKNVLRTLNSHQVLDIKYFNFTREISEIFAIPHGAFLNVFLPKEFIQNGFFWRGRERIYELRFESLKNFLKDIRYLSNKRVLIAFPDIISTILVSNELNKNNIDHIKLIKENKKEYLKNLKIIFDQNPQKPILAVGNAILNPFPELEEIFVICENTQSYQQNFRYPQIDFRVYLNFLAKNFKIPLTYYDWVPTVKTFFDLESRLSIPKILNFQIQNLNFNNFLKEINKEGSSIVIFNSKQHPFLKKIKRNLVKKSLFYLFRDNKKDFLILDDVLRKLENKVLITTEVILKPINWEFDKVILIEPERFLFFDEFPWRNNERLLRILKFDQGKETIIFTKNQEIFYKFLDLQKFYLNEINERKKFKLPPFYVIVNIEFKAKNLEDSKIKFEKIEEILKKEFFFLNLENKEYKENEKLAKANLILPPDKSLTKSLKNLPPYVKVFFNYF